MELPTAYVIDVCMTCGAHAVWPFSCGHRDINQQWTMPIRVKPTPSTRAMVLRAVAREARDGT